LAQERLDDEERVLGEWAPTTMPEELARVLREKGLRVSGLEP
jgi:hypothetical protein